ncbi:mesenchyme-specific cell surface glycoprotein-like [Gigantopelta aegis]|uniref:mesenchyme-specific cell surface glycoprotein-like n=1 Tax=Gigantopelta aegis TaxID=1735272 RepID=UPI001B88994B|nr:mesenchyme-specific cell surface glycoprotein-like [Gigantopelta aegis]
MATAAQTFSVSLTNPTTLYIPYKYKGSEPVYKVDENTIEQMAYDSSDKLVYIVGRSMVNVIDISKPDNMTILHHFTLDNADLTDVETCGRHVFVSYRSLSVKESGNVLVYEKYNKTEHKMILIHDITVGSMPDMILPTHDCSRIVVSLEGNAYVSGGAVIDPPGRIGIISFPGGFGKDKEVNYTELDFLNYNNRVADLEKTGVRFVYRENNNSFSNDVEPEYLAINKDSTMAYVGLQENNAIAVVDLTQMNITAVHGLGFKNWNNSFLDPSDKDGGIKMGAWPIYGIYSPDAIKLVTWKGVDYIVTANEGGSKDYDDVWTEERRGHDFTDAMLSAAVGDDLRSALRNDSQLGRLKFTDATGKNLNGTFDALYTFGGRSFSILRADTMEMVYDSGDDVERKIKQHRPEIFNSKFVKSKTPLKTRDSRSQSKGPEPESVTYGVVDDHLLLFIGSERPGFVSVYSVADDITKPRFEFLYDGISDVDMTFQQLYDQRKLNTLDPEDIRFVDGSSSPTGKPILLITGTVSESLTIVNVDVTDTISAAVKPDCAGLAAMILLAAVCFLVGRRSH